MLALCHFFYLSATAENNSKNELFYKAKELKSFLNKMKQHFKHNSNHQ